MNRPRTAAALAALALAAALCAPHADGAAAAPGAPADVLRAAPLPCYTRRQSPAQTLLATREAYRAWNAAQERARQGLRWGPWHASGPLPAASAPGDGLPATPADPATGEKKHQTKLRICSEWKDGRFIPLLPSPDARRAARVVAARTVNTSAPVVLSIGIGGGDRITLRGDSGSLRGLDTRVVRERYGTGSATDQILADQAIVDVALPAGESLLAVEIVQDAIHARAPFRFWFSPAPDPLPRLWQRIRLDFPPHEHRLLEAVPHAWFDPGGWFESGDTHFEREFLASVLAAEPALDPVLRPRIDVLARASAGPSDLRWLDLCTAAAEAACALADLRRLSAAVADLGRGFGGRYPAAAHLARVAALRDRVLAAAGGRLDPADPEGRALLDAIVALRHEALVGTNPLLRGRRLLFVRRSTYDSQHYYDDYYHGIRAWGGNLCELDLVTGRVRELVPALAGGIFDRYDLSFDARAVVFGYRAPRPEGYRIWEVGLDGTGLRQLTFPPPDEASRVARHSAHSIEALRADPRLYGHWTDDLHPCYLPDGGIAFVSSRPERSVLCGGHSLTCTALHRIEADGSGLRRLSEGALSEFTPATLADGRLLYNRWEYVFKGIAAIQPLWAMRPDGSASEEIYGDNIDNPGVFVQARPVPGRHDLVVATGCGHEPLAVGAIELIDLVRDKRSRDAMTHLTPEVETRGLRGLCQFRNGRWVENDLYGPFYCDPCPLADPETGAGAGRFFLVSCNPHSRYNDPRAYGIHLLDSFGNRVPVHCEPDMSCWQPTLVAPRPRPPVLPSVVSAPVVASERGAPEATLILSDVSRGLDGVPPGTVRYLRVMEQIPRSWTATQIAPGDSCPGQSPAISNSTHIWVAVLLGVVPVEPDGSAHLVAPAGRNLYLQALDAEFIEVQKMRTFINLQPGETRSCIGCHEHRKLAPAPRPPLALRRAASRLAPQPGDAVAARPVHYPADVQPVLDRHCIACHGGAAPKGALDLTGALTEHFTRSYENLLVRGLVHFLQEWTAPPPDKRGPYHLSNGSMSHAEPIAPRSCGSHASRLIAFLRAGHHGVALSRAEFVRLVTWIDTNAPFYGSYFGRRNIRYREHPEFRPVPTLDSARGVPPRPVPPAPMPAELLAWWRLDGGAADAGRCADASGHGRDARVVRAPPRSDGVGFLQGEGFGRHEAVSVALWVRPEKLENRWNPILFTDGAGVSSFHFSLLADGTPNVAIHTADRQWVHSRATAVLGTGRWHHVAVVCDPRWNGKIRFYADGRSAGVSTLDLGVPIDLAAFRVGAWKGWEKTPSDNFHGAMRDIRIYRGLLADPEVAELARRAPAEEHPPSRAQRASSPGAAARGG